MIASGVRLGDRVAVWAPNGHRFVVAALGAVTAGAVLVPVNTRFKGAEAGWVLAKSAARLLLVENGFLGHDYLAMLDEVGVGLPALAEVVTLDGGGDLPWDTVQRIPGRDRARDRPAREGVGGCGRGGPGRAAR